MLTQVRLTNYRCFKDATIKLAPFTVFVGANSSGKTTLLKALTEINEQGDLAWRHSASLPVVRELFQGDSARCIVRSGKGKGLSIEGSFPRAQYLHLDLRQLRSQNMVADVRLLQQDGGNLANVFATLTRKQQGEVARQFCELVPTFQDLDVKPTEHGHHELRFQDRWAPTLWYRPIEVSDGTMLVAAYVLLQHQQPVPELLAIEEPERELHPFLVGQLVSLFRKMSLGQVGSGPVQIVLATHSAVLLDYIEPSDARFLSRDKTSGEVKVEEAPIGAPDWRESYRTYQDSLGGLWLSGGLGGVPG